MCKLKQKSEFNIDAANYLINKANLYAPSVHCSYYSCLQRLKFLIKDYYKITYDEQDIIRKKRNQRTNQFIIKFIVLELKKDGFDRREERRFSRNIKELREQADYQDIEIDISQSQKAYSIAKEVLTFIKTNF